jgi:hypothetical protein
MFRFTDGESTIGWGSVVSSIRMWCLFLIGSDQMVKAIEQCNKHESRDRRNDSEISDENNIISNTAKYSTNLT